MAIVYSPPGVTVRELSSPSVTPFIATPTNVCLVGPTQGYLTATQQVVFGASTSPHSFTVPTGAIFQKVSTTQTFVSAIDALNPSAGASDQSGYEETTDYTATLSSDKTTVTITPVTNGYIANNGATVNFVYRYVPTDYFTAIRLDSQASIEARFGAAYTDDGSAINCTVSYAAGLAFENGASNIVIQPLFKLADPADPASARSEPSTSDISSVSVWDSTFQALRDFEDINVIVPVIGQSATGVGDQTQHDIIAKLQDHVHYMVTQGQYLIGIVGEDSSTSNSNAQMTTLRSHATDIRARYGGGVAEQMVFLSPASYVRLLPSSSNTRIIIGGQYVAAAVAGMLAARPVTSTLTRKQISGIQAIAEVRNKQDKNADAAAGLMVIEQVGDVVRVRHAITTSNETIAKRELSVVRAKHLMIESITGTLEDQIIGQVPADGNAPFVVASAVVAVLERLRGDGDLVTYSDVQARTLDQDPTNVEVRFSYMPAFPLDYITVIFSLDLTQQEVTVGIGLETV